jgi:hypothetical protein
MEEIDINRAGLSHVNDDRIAALLTLRENPMVKQMNEQSRYVRKWFIFIAIFALSLSKEKISNRC